MKLNYVNCFDRVRGIKTRNSFIVKHLKFLFYIFVFAPQKCPKSVNQRTNVLHFYEDFLFCIYGWFRMNGTEWPVSWQSRVNTEQPTLTTSTTPDQFVFFFVLVVVSACRVIASIAANENVTVIIELTELSFRFRSFDVVSVFNIDRLTAVSGKNTHEFKKFPLWKNRNSITENSRELGASQS